MNSAHASLVRLASSFGIAFIFFGALLFVRVVSVHIFPPNIYTMDIQLMGCSYDID